MQSKIKRQNFNKPDSKIIEEPEIYLYHELLDSARDIDDSDLE